MVDARILRIYFKCIGSVCTLYHMLPVSTMDFVFEKV